MNEIYKIEAAGNDFLFFSIDQGVPNRERIQALCDRHFGIGADGLVVVEMIDKNHSRWQFFNSDGSVAAMCGNAARAAGAWLKRAGQVFPHHLETAFGEVILGEHVTAEHHGFTARVPYVKRPLSALKIEVDISHDTTGLLHGSPSLIDTGVPHVVVELKSPVLSLARERATQLNTLASKFRWTKQAGPGGANVTFFSRVGLKSDGTSALESVTFERGVEALTLACGTGVLAAATVASGMTWPKQGFEVHTLGATLWVESEDFPQSLTLIGPANIVFSAKLISSR